MVASHQKSRAQVTSALIAVRTWEKMNLPLSQSTLAYEIILLIAHHTVCNKPLTLHQLFYSIDYSETGIRKQLTKLIKDDWCSLIKGTSDKRLKHVVASEKLLILLDNYAIEICELLVDKLNFQKTRLKLCV
jgi:hypothetical protein